MADYWNHRIQMFALIEMMFSQLQMENRTTEKSVKNGARKIKLTFSLYNKAGLK